MPIYCLKCKAHTESTDETPFVSKNGRNMIRSKCVVCNGGKCRILGLATTSGGAITDEATHHAKLAAAAYEKPNDRLEWLKDKGITEYDIDNEFSNEKEFVAHNPDTKKTVYSIRGTVPTNISDLASDLAIAYDTEKVFKLGSRYNDSLKKANSVINKYGKENTTLTGHSLGATISSNIGKELDLSSYNYNTGSSLADLGHGVRKRIGCKVTDSEACERDRTNTKYYRTTIDPISLSSISQVGTHHRIAQKS